MDICLQIRKILVQHPVKMATGHRIHVLARIPAANGVNLARIAVQIVQNVSTTDHIQPSYHRGLQVHHHSYPAPHLRNLESGHWQTWRAKRVTAPPNQLLPPSIQQLQVDWYHLLVVDYHRQVFTPHPTQDLTICIGVCMGRQLRNIWRLVLVVVRLTFRCWRLILEPWELD